MPGDLTFQMPDVPDAGCCAFYGPAGSYPCECSPTERALRAWHKGRWTVAMTPDQREWCLRHIEQVEGYCRQDHERDADAKLAGNVMFAWADYCRDKGLL